MIYQFFKLTNAILNSNYGNQIIWIRPVHYRKSHSHYLPFLIRCRLQCIVHDAEHIKALFEDGLIPDPNLSEYFLNGLPAALILQAVHSPSRVSHHYVFALIVCKLVLQYEENS